MTTMLSELPTPAAIVDETRLMRNLQRMQDRMDALGVAFRPHVKTTKCIEIAQRQLELGARGITVSTLKEADCFFAAGFADILYAACIPPRKLDRAIALRKQGCALTVVVDSVSAATALVSKGKAEQHAFDVMIEVDTDGHRAGAAPAGRELIAIADALVNGGASLRGVMTHAGSSYELDTQEAIATLAGQERSLIVQAAERLRTHGFNCERVSVGSTPTALSAQELSGATEVRAGVYAFFDLVMCNIGVCTPDEVALSVLATVVGHQAKKGWAIVDAGWMAMSRDRGTARQALDYGYGAVCAENGQIIGDYVLASANQEHGIIRSRSAAPDCAIATRFPLGSLVRILPNHACATGAQFGSYALMQSDGSIKTLERFNGW
jgi:threo-3-hydroxy-D-aspartate ammonia-lyase